MFTKKRCDGTYIKDLPYFTRIVPYAMPTRTEAAIYFEQDFDVTKTMEYVRKANEGCPPGTKNLTLFQVLLCATVRTVAFRPKLNRFVAGLRYYQRNRIAFNFITKRELTDGGEEINVTIGFSPFETLKTLPPKVAGFVAKAKRGESNDSDDFNKLLAKLPRWINKLVVKLLFWVDYQNGLPYSFIKGMPFFATVFFTNVGSVGIDAPFHHNFEFGTCGLFIALGKIRTERVIGVDGMVEERQLVKVTFTYDDRIADGIYCGKGIDLLRSYVEDPSLLEAPPELSPELLAELNVSVMD